MVSKLELNVSEEESVEKLLEDETRVSVSSSLMSSSSKLSLLNNPLSAEEVLMRNFGVDVFFFLYRRFFFAELGGGGGGNTS